MLGNLQSHGCCDEGRGRGDVDRAHAVAARAHHIDNAGGVGGEALCCLSEGLGGTRDFAGLLATSVKCPKESRDFNITELAARHLLEYASSLFLVQNSTIQRVAQVRLTHENSLKSRVKVSDQPRVRAKGAVRPGSE